MYGQRKPIARRTPLFPASSRSKSGAPSPPSSLRSTATAGTTISPLLTRIPDSIDLFSSTPTATEGDTATETELDTEIEIDYESCGVPDDKKTKLRYQQWSPTSSVASSTTLLNGDGVGGGTKSRKSSHEVVSQHDLLNKYFRRDTVILRNVDLFRSVSSSPPYLPSLPLT